MPRLSKTLASKTPTVSTPTVSMPTADSSQKARTARKSKSAVPPQPRIKQAAPALMIAQDPPLVRSARGNNQPVGDQGVKGKGQRIGYVRVSSREQNTARQLENVDLDDTYTDYASGKDVARPGLDEMLRFIRKGDTLIVHSMDRLARNLDDLRRLVGDLTAKGVRVEFVKEGLVFTGEDSAMSKLLLSVMGAFAEFERSLIRERQREGIALAQKRGAYKGRKKSLSPDQVANLKARVADGEAKAALARELGLSRETIYQYLKHTC